MFNLWYLRHWLQYWQLRTWNHDNLCYLTINCDTGQHSQFLRCFPRYPGRQEGKKDGPFYHVWFSVECLILGGTVCYCVFVRWIIWHRAEESNWIIMSQILSFLTHLTSLPVGSISSSHSKISAICWCHFLVWVLIPIDGAAIDGDMLSIVLRTFLARSS